MRATRIPIGLFVALLALTSCDGTEPPPPDACQPGPCSSELAYEWNGDIIVFDAATGGTRQLTSRDSLTYNGQPAWSPDGERIAFGRDNYVVMPDGSFAGRDPLLGGIHVMNSDGTGVRQVTRSGSVSPSWSPLGDALAFMKYQGCNALAFCAAIYVQDLSDGSVMRQVAASGDTPAWSPDGSRIAFVRTVHPDNDVEPSEYSLALVNPDGSGLTDIVPLASTVIGRPTWSPDGTRLAFGMFGNMGWAIYVIRADGTGRTQLTLGATPAWSPDGTRIAYYSDGSILEIPAEGGQPTSLTSGAWPSWRP